MSRLIKALKLTGRRRFAQRAVASCRYAGKRRRERAARRLPPMSVRVLVPLWSYLFSNSGLALALPATDAAVLGTSALYGRQLHARS